MRYLTLALVLLCSACQPTRTVTVVLPAGLTLDPSAWSYAPRWAVRHARADDTGRLSIEVRGAVRIEHAALCPIQVDAETTSVEAHARLSVRGAQAQVGYDAPIELEAVTCDARSVSFRQVEGEALADWKVEGHTLHARTLPREKYFPAALPDALLAVSPRTQGRYVVEVATGALRERVVITSIARATGLSSVATDQTVMLGAAGWKVDKRPRDSEARIVGARGVDTFRADRAGAYRLTRDDGQALELRALTHERTPMDCGRAECHATESALTAQSPMSHAFEHAESCMIGCHTTGELGIDDGGFSALARELGFTKTRPDAELPRALHRLAGVRCTACHGPGAIPTPEGRARILRTDVCATCHDAPPRYTHVMEWQRSAMARADVDPRTRADERCAGCHTTGGFLDRIGVRKREDRSRDPDGLQVGITCAACHAPHGKSGDKLVRVVSEDAPLCASCHAPFDARAAHKTVSCTGCHGATQGKLDHSFQVRADVCGNCHAGKTMDSIDAAALAREVATLRERIGRRCSVPEGPLHASEPHCEDQVSRALSLLALVADDRGAAWHNGAFAHELLARARALLESLHDE